MSLLSYLNLTAHHISSVFNSECVEGISSQNLQLGTRLVSVQILLLVPGELHRTDSAGLPNHSS